MNMKASDHMRYILLVAALFPSFLLQAQCDHDPVITPGDTILCPNSQVELMTQFGAESYQWYMNGSPIVGANGPTHTVTSFDSGVPYTVEVTVDGCAEMSPGVLVDGWNFVSPTVMHLGDEPIAMGPNGESIYCEGQDVQLQFNMPYTENIVWTNNGVVIPGENSPLLVVTESGSYNVSGAPAECPDYIAQLGVTIEIEFQQPQQPTIMASGDEICAFPLGQSYVWYLDDVLIEEETQACIIASALGSYTVYVDYGQDCQVISDPFITTSIDELSSATWQIHPNPTAGTINISMDPALSAGAFYTIFDAIGQQVKQGWMPLNGLLQLELSSVENGTYLFQAARDGKAMAPATRFTIVK